MLKIKENKNQIKAKRRPGVIACLLFCGSKLSSHLVFSFGFSI